MAPTPTPETADHDSTRPAKFAYLTTTWSRESRSTACDVEKGIAGDAKDRAVRRHRAPTRSTVRVPPPTRARNDISILYNRSDAHGRLLSVFIWILPMFIATMSVGTDRLSVRNFMTWPAPIQFYKVMWFFSLFIVCLIGFQTITLTTRPNRTLSTKDLLVTEALTLVAIFTFFVGSIVLVCLRIYNGN